MTTAIQKVNELIGADKAKELMAAGICFLWKDEFNMLQWAANAQEHDKKTYRALDNIKKAQN